ncbi:Uncharacterized protein OS=Singulisphaera acidiphila (strain ATCC BAA-1392 / DSM 18658 / VKM B-2454 / MOB10) GN=Sinac_1105 PE=4 SV=1 [Gemmata massiliana]|uniref:Uncharacterized protein n=1 Tax=Gemmata massiliana TaxID=1210884 RepID=A0A6P2D662_9BACT|nr:periplasmic heavy metal sensor [Gemmata massiliana]VTR96407.1 Uncharacterized protein OS=Singulisphaera acidiphila (strain ATCC BAA-1392 / DSM 18658 / VKM B-2454 / MOB10) GN=Sinac_1105 PE=4 SV=1 [Gemmata massiliana]
MRAIRCLVAALLAAGIVTVVAAQPGRGGFGFGGQDVNSLVLTNVALQEEIKLTNAQKDKLKPAVEKQAELNKKRTELFSQGFKNVDKDKIAELTEEGAKVTEEVKKVVDETLNADQKKRLKQISIQVMNFTVFNDPEAKGGNKGGNKNKGGFNFGPTDAQKAVMKEVAEALKLSDSQKSTVKGLVDEFNKESRELFAEAGGKGQFDPEKFDAANKKVDKLRKETWAKVEEALDATQKTAWKGLVGEPFDTAKLRPTFPKKD